ncbi:MAG: FHA domain-containing protein [Anaerolineae bacterium]|nr:FHA domain-containing protein [Anaerolineae bacterium]
MAYMIVTPICPNCRYDNDEHAQYCAQCGTPLVDDLKETTLRVADLPPGQAAHLKRMGSRHTSLLVGAIVLFVGSESSPVIIKSRDQIVIGRGAPGAQPPNVDLNDYDGYTLGVSRRHAVITHTGGGYTLTDLGSANGTWLNDQRLEPNTPYALCSSDKIQFGQLVLSAYF